MTQTPSRRSSAARIAAARDRLAGEPDVWVATASPDGVPHLIPLSLAWIDEAVYCVTPTDAPTTANISATGLARVSLASTLDVVVMETSAVAVPLTDAAPPLVDEVVRQMGWDPRSSDVEWSLLTFEPLTIRAWNSEPEIDGRVIMRNRMWVE